VGDGGSGRRFDEAIKTFLSRRSSSVLVLCNMSGDEMSLNFDYLFFFRVEMGLKTQDWQGTLVVGA
jgi:hypothetical protein